MKVIQITTNYKIENKEYEIFVCKYIDGRISLMTGDKHDKFWFSKSDPETLMNVGKMIVKASKI